MTKNYRITDVFKYYTQNENGCWIWNGARGSEGYPELRREGKVFRMHREFYAIHKGEIPRGVFVCHTCDVRNCVNPDHLFIGTPKENTHDMISKGRNVPPRSGERHNHAKLTECKVLEVIGLAKEGCSYRSIARKFGMHHTTISDLINGKNWKHLTNGATA